MSDSLPLVYLARHGQTAWTISGQHTGVTDLPLTSKGEAEAVWLRTRLDGMKFAAVLTSPLRRAVTTCELAGFGAVAAIEADLREWNYGAYEGRTSAEITLNAPTGNFSETVVRKESRPTRSELGPTESCFGSGQSRETRSSSRAGTFFECSLRAGSVSSRGQGDFSFSALPVSVLWGTSTIVPSQ